MLAWFLAFSEWPSHPTSSGRAQLIPGHAHISATPPPICQSIRKCKTRHFMGWSCACAPPIVLFEGVLVAREDWTEFARKEWLQHKVANKQPVLNGTYEWKPLVFKPQFISKRCVAAWCITIAMLGHYPNVEKSQLVNYVEDYLECVESLPLDIQRNVSLLREIDTKYQGKRNICERCQYTPMYISVRGAYLDS